MIGIYDFIFINKDRIVSELRRRVSEENFCAVVVFRRLDEFSGFYYLNDALAVEVYGSLSEIYRVDMEFAYAVISRSCRHIYLAVYDVNEKNIVSIRETSIEELENISYMCFSVMGTC